MKKLIAVAALCATSFAVPVLPVQAAPALSKAEANCLIFPIFKKECWELGAKQASAVPKAASKAGSEMAQAALDVKVPLPWWKCTAAAKGSGHLLDC